MKTRIFFASDVHSSEVCYLKFLNSGKFYKSDVIMLCGDLTGKAIVPIVKQNDGKYTADFLDQKKVLSSPEERLSLEKVIRNSGYYFYYTTPEELNELKADPGKLDVLFSKLMCDAVERWIGIAEQRLKGSNIKCIISPGNDDRYEIDTILRKSDLIINPEEKVILLDEKHEMITVGSANPTPFHCPRDLPEEELERRIENMVSSVKDLKNCVFNTHVPPYNTQLDTAPILDENLKVVAKGGQIQYGPAGSTAVRKAIETHQPILGLHGHIHESRAAQKIGRTLCINPGSEYQQGILRGALIDLKDEKIEQHYLTSG